MLFRSTWFREWGLEARVVGLVDDFPLIREHLRVLAFRKARNKGEEAAELFVNPETGRHGVVAILPGRLADAGLLPILLGHELYHLSDMVNPSFHYSPEWPFSGLTSSQQRLVRERYRLLWAVSIDGRLAGTGRKAATGESGHRPAMERLFGFWDASSRDGVFEELWRGGDPVHPRLLELAGDPRGLSRTQSLTPGGVCPLCRFTTYDWATPESLAPEVVEVVRGEFPGWRPDEGCCARCAEIYTGASHMPPG